jgi:hypothetical protein
LNNNFYLRRESSSIFRTPSRQQLQGMKSESQIEYEPSISEFPHIEENSIHEEKYTPPKSRLLHNHGEYIDLTGNYIGDILSSSPSKAMFAKTIYRTN